MKHGVWLAGALALAVAMTVAAEVPTELKEGLAAAAAGGDREAARVQAELVLSGDLAGDREAARQLLSAAAQRGDAQAACDLGVLAYRQGDLAAAKAHWAEAAAADHPDAHYNLGLLLAREPDSAGAADQEFEAAARHRHVLACFALGTRLVTRDEAAARRWLECAASQGYAPAQYNLATLHARAPHTPASLDAARRWYGAAAPSFAPAAAALAALSPSSAEVEVKRGGTALSLHDHAWVMAQAGAAYTVQVASGNSASDIESLLQRELASGDAACVREHPNSRQPYSAIVGIYPDRASAENARADLPASLRALNPWVRRVSTLQQALREVDPPLPAAADAQAGSN